MRLAATTPPVLKKRERKEWVNKEIGAGFTSESDHTRDTQQAANDSFFFVFFFSLSSSFNKDSPIQHRGGKECGRGPSFRLDVSNRWFLVVSRAVKISQRNSAHGANWEKELGEGGANSRKGKRGM